MLLVMAAMVLALTSTAPTAMSAVGGIAGGLGVYATRTAISPSFRQLSFGFAALGFALVDVSMSSSNIWGILVGTPGVVTALFGVIVGTADLAFRPGDDDERDRCT